MDKSWLGCHPESHGEFMRAPPRGNTAWAAPQRFIYAADVNDQRIEERLGSQRRVQSDLPLSETSNFSNPAFAATPTPLIPEVFESEGMAVWDDHELLSPTSTVSTAGAMTESLFKAQLYPTRTTSHPPSPRSKPMRAVA